LFLQKTTPKVYKQPPTEDIYPKSVHHKIFAGQNRKEQKTNVSTKRWSVNFDSALENAFFNSKAKTLINDFGSKMT